MNVNEMKVGELKDLLALVQGSGAAKKKRKQIIDGKIRIVVLQRGWVLIGRYYQDGEDCRLENANVIRAWGTTNGLGELALEGPKSATKLDPTPTARFHELTTVLTIDCVEEKWSAKFPR